jgi:RND superfamily putative drug exporter
MFHTYGEFIARRSKIMLGLAGLALVVAGVLGFGAFGKLKAGGFDDPAADSSRAQRVIEAEYGGQVNLVLLVEARAATVDAPEAREAGQELASELAGESTVTNVVSYWSTRAPSLRSADGSAALVLGHVTGDGSQIANRTEALIEKYTGDHAAISVRAGGDAAANHDVTSEVARSLAIAEAIAIPVTLLLLVLAFGSMVAASLPLAIGGVAILGTFAELFVLGSVTDVSVFAINLTTALGLGLGIDYALLLVARFREQLATGQSAHDAVVRTVETAGRTIVFSAGTVAAALAALLVFPLFFLRSFAYAGIGVVAIAAVAALVVVPALLAILGHRVNSGRLPWSRTIRSGSSALWGRIAATVMRRPAIAAMPVLVALLVAASPLLGASFGTPDQGVLPASAASRQVADKVRTDFAGNDSAAIDVVVTGPVAAASLAAYAEELSRLPGVRRVDSSSGTFAEGERGPGSPFGERLGRPDAQRLAVVTTLETKSPAAQDLVQAVRDVPGPGGAATLVGGDDARLVDTKHSIGGRLPLAALLIVTTTFVLLFLFTGSVIQPLRALALNALSLSATLGVMTWIFQDGHLASVLGFTPRPMDTSMTVLLFCIAFGLSMDYEVFLTSRIKELHDNGANATDAVVHGLSHTGRIVSTAAGLLAVSFFAFGTSSVSFLQMFGLGSGLAILIDATLIRGILVPAAMRLFGRRAWYAPAPLRRLHARVALAEA